jgi:hypothetical protein
LPDVILRHNPELDHHLKQGLAWLSACAEGENTAALSYAAFEFRFAIERLALHYWIALLNRKVEEKDFRDITSFKRIEKRIYELAGNQLEINGHFEFMRIVLGALKLENSFQTPAIGKLSKLWHDCSEFCHIAWPLGCSDSKARKTAFNTLTQISESLSVQINSIGWPVIQDPSFVELRNQFIAGTISAREILAHIKKIGMWAKAEFTDGTPSKFVGEAVPPSE